MKNKLFILIMTWGVLLASCSLVEEPPFLSNESTFSSLTNAQSALDGVYGAMGSYNYYGNHYQYQVNGSSGFFVSGKGNRNTHADNLNLCSLKPKANSVTNEAIWKGFYQAIGRANDVIKSMTIVDPAMATNDEMGMNDVIGQAYFARAFTYFNIVRLFGDAPLRLEPTTPGTVHMAKAPAEVIYDQIISDAELAASLMNDKSLQRTGYPANLAANMLLAKVHMTLATAPVELQDGGVNYWQMAYDEAKKVYGAYTLLSDYNALWMEETSNNTSESIFEIQYNEIASSNFVRLWTGTDGSYGSTWGRLRINPERYDLHAASYPGDPRIAGTYVSTYFRHKKGTGYFKSHPDVARTNFRSGYPYSYKYWQKTPIQTNYNNQNYVAFRYADLLLMLAEISNELNNGEQMGYVSEVLARVGLVPSAEYNGGQDSFRNAIMKEYQFELIGEGQDWFTNRRRGFDYFRDKVIVPHNEGPLFNSKIDVTLHNDESVMLLPFPSIEINTNQEINE